MGIQTSIAHYYLFGHSYECVQNTTHNLMWTIEEIPPLTYENDAFGKQLTECETVIIPPRDCRMVLLWIESHYEIPRHIKRVNKVTLEDETRLHIIVRPMTEAKVEYPESITCYEFGKAMVPWSAPMKKEDYDKWEGWPCKWYLPNWQPKKLDWSNDDLTKLYRNLYEDSLKESKDHCGCGTNSCIIVDYNESILSILARSQHDETSSRISDSIWSPTMCSLLANHSIMKSLRYLAHRVRESELEMDRTAFAIADATPKNRIRVGRRTGTERSVIKKIMKASENEAVLVYINDEADKGNRYDKDMNASQYYATGLTAAVLGSDICLMCAMGLVHSRISRLLLFHEGEVGGASFQLFRSKVVRMHADEKRLNHSFTVYDITKNK